MVYLLFMFGSGVDGLSSFKGIPALFAQDPPLLGVIMVHDVLTEDRAIRIRDGDLDQEHCFLLFMLRFVLLAAGQVHPDQQPGNDQWHGLVFLFVFRVFSRKVT